MFEIIAHRGYSAAYRENSAAAWQGAIAAGAEIIEVDVRRTADGALVCAHDPDLRLVADPRLIADLTRAELAEVHAEPGQPVAPSLNDVFATIPPTTAILFDVKDEAPEVLSDLHALRAQWPEHRLIFGLHSPSSVDVIRNLGDATILGLLSGGPEDDTSFFERGGTILRLWESKASPERVARLRDQGHPFWMTTGGHGTGREVGDCTADVLLQGRQAGFSGFLVNDPVYARRVLTP